MFKLLSPWFLSQSQLVWYLCPATQSLSFWILVLFSACCFRHKSGVSHIGLSVTEEWSSEVCPEIHRKEHFSEMEETPESLAGVSPAEGGGRGGAAQSQVWIGHLFTQHCTLEKSKKNTNQPNSHILMASHFPPWASGCHFLALLYVQNRLEWK